MVRRYIAFLLLPLFLIACEEAPAPFTLRADSDLDFPVQVDLIAVNDSDIGATLHAHSKNWFEIKGSLLAQYGNAVAVSSYQLPPYFSHEEAKWPAIRGVKMFMIALQFSGRSDFMAIDANSVKEIHINKAGIQVKT